MMTNPHASTGQSMGSPERCWDLFSIRVPFFWSVKQTVTYWALSISFGSSCAKTLPSLSLNVTFSALSRRVLPGFLVRQNSHALIAKKYAPRTKSEVCCGYRLRVMVSKLSVGEGAGPLPQNRLTVLELWGGSILHHGLRSRNDDATQLTASLRDVDTICFVRSE
jgi:hypothetical protein